MSAHLVLADVQGVDKEVGPEAAFARRVGGRIRPGRGGRAAVGRERHIDLGFNHVRVLWAR